MPVDLGQAALGLVTALLFGLGTLVGFLLWWGSRQELRTMKRTATVPVAALRGMSPGTFVELQGIARCAAPLTSCYTGTRCVYDEAETKKVERGSRTRYAVTEFSEKQSVPFELEDETGRVRVDPAGTEFRGTVLLSEEEPLDSLADHLLYSKKVRTETALPVDQPVYVLGVLREDGSIGAPPKGDERPFIIAAGTEREARAESRSWGCLGLVLGIVCLVFAVGGVWMIIDAF